jgi:putative cell wall-binding protein
MRRRLRLLFLLAVFAIAAGGLPPLPAGAVPPPAPRFLTAALAGQGPSVHGRTEAPGTFDLVGLAFDGPEQTAVSVRTSADGRSWSPWRELHVADGEGPDRGSTERHAGRRTGPLWTGAARHVEYRLVSPDARPVRDVRLHAVDATGHAESLLDKAGRQLRALLAGVEQPLPAARALTADPPIVSRAAWGANESLVSDPPAYGHVELAVVHHTVDANDYAASDVPAMLRAIQTYHVRSNGWNDIGYNFLVDRFGRIYEGRGGGITKDVIGAHAEGFNTVSTGISLIGTFIDQAPTAEALAATRDLLAWRLDYAHVDPTSEVTVTSGGSGRWPEGASVTTRAVSGHRDLQATACPGDLAYGELDALAAAAAALGHPKFYDPGMTPDPAEGDQDDGYGPATIHARATEPLAWSITISHPVLGTLRHLTALPTANLAKPWDGRDDSGRALPGGRYEARIEGTGPNGAARPGTVTISLDNTNEPEPVDRLAGDDRFATAAAVAEVVAPATVSDVVIASGESSHLVDSLVAAPFALTKKAPVLLTAGEEIPAPTTAALDRLRPTAAWIIGGPAAVPDAIGDALAARGISVRRLAGATAPGTAAEVARAMGGPRLAALVVSRAAANLVDGLAASGAGAGLGRPVVLVTRDEVPPETRQVLNDMGTQTVWAVGGTAAISEPVVKALNAKRIAGVDRYATAVAVADAAIGAGLKDNAVAVASGSSRNMVDALAGGALGTVVLLTERDKLPDIVWKLLYDHRTGITRAWVLGGTAAVRSTPQADVRHAINAR